MKKLIALFLSLVMMLSLTPLQSIIMPNANAVDSDEFDASVFWYSSYDAYLSLVRNALVEDLTDAGINFTNYYAGGYSSISQATQNDQIDTAIAMGTDLLIVNIVDTANIDAAQAIVDKAKEADLPIIFFNREVSDDVINSYENACFVGVNAAEAGEKQGIMAGEYIANNYEAVDLNGDGKISYIMMKGELGNPEAEARTLYSVEFANAILEAAGKPALEYYDPNNTDKFQPSNWSKTQAFDFMETALSTNPMDSENPIEVVLANNDDAAIGCIYALNNAEWNTGEGNSIPVFGIDATWDAADAIMAGKMTGTVLQATDGMAETITVLAENVFNGKNVFEDATDIFNVDSYAAKIRVPYEIITAENVEYPEYPELPDYPDIPSDFKVSVFWYNFADAFLSNMRGALNAELEDWGIYDYTNYNAANTQETQNDQIDAAIAEGTDILIVNIVDTWSSDAAQAIVDKAKEANLPIIFFNREVSDDVINSYENACFVGVRAAEAGETQGIMAGEHIIENYDAVDLNGDGKISYIMMKGEIGNPEAEARTLYSVEFANAILEDAGKPALEYYDPNNKDKFQPSNWSKTQAFELMETALSSNPMDSENPIEVVFANNDDAALGCIDALNNVGWNTGEGNSIPVFGIDYTQDAAYAINSGRMTGSILQSVENMAYTITWLADNIRIDVPLFNGAEDNFNVDFGVAKVRVPFEIITADNTDYPDYPDYPDDDFNASVFWYDFNDAFLSDVRSSLYAELESWGIYNYTNYNADHSQEIQNDQIDTAIAEGTDILIVNIVDTADTDAAQTIVDKAKEADIPVIFFNREVSDDIINSYNEACYVGTRFEEAGEMQGLMAGNYIIDNYDAIDLNGDGKISYIMMKGQLGNPEAEARTYYAIEYANAILEDFGYPTLEYYDPDNTDKFQVADWMQDKAFDEMTKALETNPMDGEAPIEVVFANNDHAALGCIDALNNIDWNTGEGNSIPVFGIDYTWDAADAIDSGKMTGSVRMSAEGIAYTIAWLADNTQSNVPVFNGAEYAFNVDEGVAKVRVPYEIMTAEMPIYPDDFNVSVFWYDYSDAYLSTVRDALDYNLEYWGIYNYTSYDAMNYQEMQNDQIDTAIAQGTNLLIVNIVDTADENAAQAIVDKAKEAGIPVIFFNREPADEVINSYEEACFVGVNAAEAGETQGMMAGEYIANNYDAIDLNGDGKISYIMMKGELGNPEAEMRTLYSIELANIFLEAYGYPTLEYYDPANTDMFQAANWSKTNAFELMETALSTNPMDGENPIEVVFANNDDMALGCIEALNNVDWNTGEGNSIPVFGIDYTWDAAEAIYSGKMTGSILQSADSLAYTIAWLADNTHYNIPVFAGAEDAFNVDEGVAKVRVPYEIMMGDYVDYPDYEIPDLNEGDVAIFWYDFSDWFLYEIREALNSKLDSADISYVNYNAVGYQEIQNEQIDAAIAMGAKLLIVNAVIPWDDFETQAIVDKAEEAGIPVIFFNREVSDDVINSYENACFVGTNAAEAGQKQGIMAGEYILENYDAVDLNGDGKISYIMMKGELGNPEAEMRTQYSVEYTNAILEDAGKPALEYYDPYNADKFQPSNWSWYAAFELMETALSTNPMGSNNAIEVVFANNDDAALGCIEALNNVGWNTGMGNSIPVFGIDYTWDAAEAINSGKMTGSILQSAEGIAEAVAALTENVENGNHIFENAEDIYNVDESAAKIRVPYEIIVREPTTELLMGDVTLDGIVTNADVVTLARYLVNLVSLEDRALEAADFDGNGQIRVADLIKIARSIIAA